MKSSYKKMLVFQFIIFLLLFLNSFISSILNRYSFIVLLGLSLLAFKFVFGFEKDRHRHTKDIILEVLIFLIIFFILYYLFGIKIGFVKIENYYSWYGIMNFILPVIIIVFLKEILRYMMLKKVENSKLLNFTTYIIFIFIDLALVTSKSVFNSGNEIFIFIALSLLPAITKNALFNYMGVLVGYKPAIIYSLIMELYIYLIPIVPNTNEYLTSIIKIILPILLGYRINHLFVKEKDEYIDTNYSKKGIIYLVFASVCMIAIIYLTSGYFRFHSIVIASGSMSPKIDKGDVVIIEKTTKKIDKNDIIAYRYNNVIVVHRVVEIMEIDNEKYYYTKGDNNKVKDDYVVTEEMLIGKLTLKIPYIGFPTVWLNEL